MSGERVQRADSFAASFSSFADLSIGQDGELLSRVRARDKAIVEAACEAQCYSCRSKLNMPVRRNPDYEKRADLVWWHAEWGTCGASLIREALRSLLEPSE